jgi:Protein of unknown function (DUF2752)
MRTATTSALLRPGVARRAVVALTLVAAALLVALSDTPLCPTALVLGIPCPGCGLTRATLALLRGDLRAAVGFHPLAPVLVPLLAGVFGKALFDYVRGAPPTPPARAWWAGRTAVWLSSALLALLLGVWLARFAGYFGGPVAVESFHARMLRHVPAYAP